jgi:aryl-alcohol dehydrogenase-like predicted oxidoreductase
VQHRELGRSDLRVSALGLGCWAIGGPFWRGDQPVGWGDVDDQVSLEALERAVEVGINFFDTSDVYGCGHSERLLGMALSGRRKEVVIATKFGNIWEESSRRITGFSGEPAFIRKACEGSLRRLQTDYIDLYQFHIGNYDLGLMDHVIEVLEQLVDEGKIRWYGWSTDDPERAAFIARGEHCAAIQQRFNLFEGNELVLRLCEAEKLASINRSPLAMGLLTGKFKATTTFADNDVRRNWNLSSGEPAKRLQRMEEIREVLTVGGRTVAQGAIAWLWTRSGSCFPIPGFRTPEQVTENAAAMAFGLLSPSQMNDIQELVAAN